MSDGVGLSYALSQREPSVAKSSPMFAAWSLIALWDISAASFVLVLFREVCNAVSNVVGGTAAGSEAEAPVVNRGLQWSMERLAQEDGGRHSLETVSTKKRELHRCSIPCGEFADEEVVTSSGKLSCVFDSTESLPPPLMSRLNRFMRDELSVMVSASTFDKEQTCSQRWDDSMVKSTFLRTYICHLETYLHPLESLQAVP